MLHIQSSPNFSNSVTRKLSDRFVEAWLETHANVEVDLLDLARDPLPHFGEASLLATAPKQHWSDETKAAVSLSDKLVNQLEAADLLVIGAPMINFSICTQLKSWFDFVAVPGRTFQYAAPGVSKGLLFGKKAFVIIARGGDYADPPMTAFDFQEPLLRMLLGFMGIYDVTFIRAEGMRQRAEDAEHILRNAEDIILRVAA